jgi:hypothetical protein
MIVRLDKEKQRTARHQLLNNVVYIISHEALKQMQRDGHTELSPVEVFLSARNFCDSILELPDIEEGLDDEMDDLEDETEVKDDYMLILTLVTVQLQAMSKRSVGIDFKKIIFRIFERLEGYEFLWPLIEQMTDKEDSRWLAGKKTGLLDYELQEIKIDGGGSEEIKQLFADMVECSDKMDKETIKGNLLFLNRYNIDHNHAYDKEVIALFDKFGIKSTTIIKPKEYVGTKIVDTEIQNVEAGGTGVIKGMKKD